MEPQLRSRLVQKFRTSGYSMERQFLEPLRPPTSCLRLKRVTRFRSRSPRLALGSIKRRPLRAKPRLAKLKPSEIKRLVHSARRSLEISGAQPDAFLLAFVAWEALQVRILTVGLFAKGLDVKGAQAEILARQVWKKENREALFLELYGYRPANAPKVGKLFRKAQTFDSLRGRFIHGQSRTSPDRFANATADLISILESDWSQDLKFLLKKQGLRLASADPLKRPMRLTSKGK